jgi:hypothetical protein
MEDGEDYEDDGDYEDDDFSMSVDVPPSASLPPTVGRSGNFADPGHDEDEWDTESAFSDASTDILIEDDEHEVVPPSFVLSAPVHPQPNDDDELLEPPPQAKEEQPPSITVHGSNSKHPASLRNALLT